MSNDVVMLQKLMIYQCDTFILDNLNNKFNHVLCVKNNTKYGIILGRLAKGVAIFWRKNIYADVESFGIDERIRCVKFLNNNY